MARSDIPDIVIGRLPIYLRALVRLQAEEREITSSHELGERLGISSAQIRKDLSHFGEFGKQGTGYAVDTLVGVGDLGRAIAHYGGFTQRGFRITQLFDSDPTKVGKRVGKLIIRDMAEMADVLREENIRVAMIATPADHAQDVADELVAAGVHAILNYAPIIISVRKGVRVEYIDPGIHLQRMAYYLED
jgi:redox-sensing transcriptional repressor